MKPFVVTLVLGAVLVAGCSGGGDRAPPGSLSPGATTIADGPGAVTCPMATAACDLARRLQTAIRAGDAAAIATLTVTSSVRCPGSRPEGSGGPFPLCEGAPAGEMRMGVATARRYSEGAVVSPAAYRTMLSQLLQAANAQAADALGSGDMRLIAVSCADQNAQPATCPRFAAVFSAILRPAMVPPLGTTPSRELLIFFGEVQGSEVRVTEMWTGVVLPDEVTLLRQGGALFDLGRVFPYAGQ